MIIICNTALINIINNTVRKILKQRNQLLNYSSSISSNKNVKYQFSYTHIANHLSYSEELLNILYLLQNSTLSEFFP